MFFIIKSLRLFVIYCIEVRGSLKADMLCQLALNSSRAYNTTYTTTLYTTYNNTLHTEIQHTGPNEFLTFPGIHLPYQF